MAEQRCFPGEELDTPGKRIRFLRTRVKGWSQQTLAEKVYTTQPAVSMWEADKWIPHLGTQARLAEELGTTRTFLFGESLTGAA